MAATKTITLSQFLPYLLSVTSNAVSEVIAREYQTRFGLRIPEWRVMAVLGQGEERTQRDLVAATLMDKVTVNRAVKALADRGLIERVPSTSDGRSHGLLLTAAGLELYREIVPAALGIETRLSGAISEAERAELVRLLDRLRNAVDALELN